MSDARFYSGDWTVAHAVTPKLWQWPIPGDNTTKLYTQDFVIDADYYVRSSFDAEDLDDPALYLVDETNPALIGNGIVRFTRTYSQIPQPRVMGSGSDEVELYVATVPGIGYTDPITFVEYISSASTVGETTVLTITSPPHSFEANDWVSILYYAQDPGSTLIITRQVSRLISSVGASTVTVARITDGYNIVGWESVFKSLANREPFQLVVPSWISTEYFLPGVSPGISSASDIPIMQPTPIIDHVSGSRTDTITDQTSPSLDDYFAMLRDGIRIIAEPSSLTRWRGNIWERKTRYITMI